MSQPFESLQQHSTKDKKDEIFTHWKKKKKKDEILLHKPFLNLL